jgi:hypothetical protein
VYVNDRRSFGEGPTVGVSISPWVIGVLALVWLAPKLLSVTLAHSREKKKE